MSESSQQEGQSAICLYRALAPGNGPRSVGLSMIDRGKTKKNKQTLPTPQRSVFSSHLLKTSCPMVGFPTTSKIHPATNPSKSQWNPSRSVSPLGRAELPAGPASGRGRNRSLRDLAQVPSPRGRSLLDPKKHWGNSHKKSAESCGNSILFPKNM